MSIHQLIRIFWWSKTRRASEWERERTRDREWKTVECNFSLRQWNAKKSRKFQMCIWLLIRYAYCFRPMYCLSKTRIFQSQFHAIFHSFDVRSLIFVHFLCADFANQFSMEKVFRRGEKKRFSTASAVGSIVWLLAGFWLCILQVDKIAIIFSMDRIPWLNIGTVELPQGNTIPRKSDGVGCIWGQY